MQCHRWDKSFKSKKKRKKTKSKKQNSDPSQNKLKKKSLKPIRLQVAQNSSIRKIFNTDYYIESCFNFFFLENIILRKLTYFVSVLMTSPFTNVVNDDDSHIKSSTMKFLFRRRMKNIRQTLWIFHTL